MGQNATSGFSVFDDGTVERLRAGDAETYAVVFAWLRARMTQVCAHAGTPVSVDPGDCAQEALLRLLVRFDGLSFHSPARLAKWLLVTAKHYHMDHVRRARKTTPAGDPGVGDVLSAAPDLSADPERTALASIAVCNLLRTLSTPQRELLWNKLALDLSYEEIAALSGEGVDPDPQARERHRNALRQEVFRLLRRLRRLAEQRPATSPGGGPGRGAEVRS